MLISHKGKCTQILEHVMKGTYTPEHHWLPSWEELSVFVEHLTFNAKKDSRFDKDREGFYHKNILVLPSNSDFEAMHLIHCESLNA